MKRIVPIRNIHHWWEYQASLANTLILCFKHKNNRKKMSWDMFLNSTRIKIPWTCMTSAKFLVIQRLSFWVDFSWLFWIKISSYFWRHTKRTCSLLALHLQANKNNYQIKGLFSQTNIFTQLPETSHTWPWYIELGFSWF